MSKPLSQLTTEEVRQQMSIAGSPEKITEMMQEITALIGSRIDPTNAAEITNTEFALNKILSEVGLLKKMYGNKTGQKI